MSPITARRSIRHYAYELLASGASLLVAYGIITLIGGAVALWGLSVILLPSLVGLVRALRDRSEVLRIDDEGILDARLDVGRIPWDQVERVRRYGRRLYVALRDPDRFDLDASWWSRVRRPMSAVGATPGVWIRVDGLDEPAERILDAIDARDEARAA